MKHELTIRVALANSDILPWFIVNKLQETLPPGATISGSEVCEDVYGKEPVMEVAPEVAAHQRHASEYDARIHGDKDRRILELERELATVKENLEIGRDSRDILRTAQVEDRKRIAELERQATDLKREVSIVMRRRDALFDAGKASEQRIAELWSELTREIKRTQGLRDHVTVAVQTAARQEREACAKVAEEYSAADHAAPTPFASLHATFSPMKSWIAEAIRKRDT